MRLRVTVRRHALPDTPIIWSIDTNSAPTVYQLLEKINEVVPIETDGQWGLEDYAVELKGANGVNYECLHFQPVASVMKEDDEVIIRPLLTQDLRVRRISGRHQISDDGKRLYDGLALGRPLLRTPAGRPAINILPRKKRRIMNTEDDEDDEGFAALQEREAEDSEHGEPQQLLLEADLDEDDSEDDDDFAPGEDNSDAAEDSDAEGNRDRQLVLHADFDGSDSEDDEDFAPGDAEASDEDGDGGNNELILRAEFENADSDSDEQGEDHELRDEHGIEETAKDEDDTKDVQSPTGIDGEFSDADEDALAGVSDPLTRDKIRELHSAFPKSHLAVCKYILKGKGVEGDIGEAYEVLARGFVPIIPKSAITEIGEGHESLVVPRTRFKSKWKSKSKSKSRSRSPAIQRDNSDDMSAEPEEIPDPMVKHYDQHGLPPGSINAGKALSFMAEAAGSSPGPCPASKESASISATGSRSIKFQDDKNLSNGLTSTPFIDNESHEVDSSESDSDSDDSSDEDDSSSSGSSDSSSGDEETAHAVDDASSSDSSSDSSSESSSDDDAPEEASSKTSPPMVSNPSTLPTPLSQPTSKAEANVAPATGKRATRARNERRKHANALNRYKTKGILPAGTTLSELSRLKVNENTTPEDALAALEEVRAHKLSVANPKASASTPAEDDFEIRRQELLDSLASGGVEITQTPLKKYQKSPAQTQSQKVAAPMESAVDASTAVEAAKDSTSLSTESNNHASNLKQLIPNVTRSLPEATNAEDPSPSAASEALSKPDTPVQSQEPQSSSSNSSQTGPRRAKLNLGATNRLLFGALGLKTPKTKKDGEDLKSHLMKSVRPVVAPRVEEPEPTVDEDSNEDPDAWRQKIAYRAVECVQEGVELSEPPFPFVQRWDPQQRNSGQQNNKRKKDQRDQANHNDEEARGSKKQKRRKGKYTYAEEQEYLEASYEPSFQDDSMVPHLDGSLQEPSQPNDVDNEIKQHFMNDIQPPAETSQAPDDLAPLPEDPSSLPELKDGQAKVGMTIAFKSLEMSAATQWQPQISAYRTAIVISIQMDGTLQLTLAMRDRQQTTKLYDQNTGERIYDRFEVPDDDDDEDMENEEDGMLDLSFTELVEPKFVQDPPANLEDSQVSEASLVEPEDDVDIEEIAPKLPPGNIDMDGRSPGKYDPSPAESTTLSYEEESAQFSHVTETPLNSDAPESYQQERQPEHLREDQQGSGSALSADDSLPRDMEVNELPTGSAAQQEPEVDVVSSKEQLTETLTMGKLPDDSAIVSVAVEQSIVEPVTPEATINTVVTATEDFLSESVSEEAREKITHMMRDAGFCSSVPSSILRGDIGPHGMQTPGEAAAFEKLRESMAETEGDKENESGKESQAYSPKFNGLGSSPIRQPRESSRTPVKRRQTVESSPFRPASSGWETVDEEFRSSPPQITSLSPVQEGSSWVTIDQTQGPPSSPPARQQQSSRLPSPAPTETTRLPSPDQEQAGSPAASQPVTPKIDAETSARQVPVSKAQERWAFLRANKQAENSDSDSESAMSSARPSPERVLGLDDTEEPEAHASVDYPKLSIGSSFTSQVTDHGRQPDFAFDDTEIMNVDTPDANVHSNHTGDDAPQPGPGTQESPLLASTSRTTKQQQVKPGMPVQKSVKKPASSTKNVSDHQADEPSDSDSSLPSLRALSQQTTTIKRDPYRKLPAKSGQQIKRDADKKKPVYYEDDSQDSGQSTPKASQQKRRASTARSSKSRASDSRASERPPSQSSSRNKVSRAPEKPASQARASISRASQPSRASQSNPSSTSASSQFVDLTLSSDAEPEPEPEVDSPPRIFRTYNLEKDDDDSSEGSPATKKGSASQGPGNGRLASVGLRASSQTAWNARKR